MSPRNTRPVEQVLSDEEKLELELAEEARIGADDWSGGVAPGKPARFGPSFRRLIGLLRPNAAAFFFVSFLGALGVCLSVLDPRHIGSASCRERVCRSVYDPVVSVSLKNKTYKSY